MSCCGGNHKTKVHFIDEVFEPRPILDDSKHRRKSIYPFTLSRQEQTKHNKNNIEEERQKRETFTDNFLSEIIQCGSCQEKIALKERKQLYNCSSCDKFFCCNFAGACVGEECSIQFEGKKQSLSYCMNCVNPYFKINIQENGQCLCKTCENIPDIPNHYKEV